MPITFTNDLSRIRAAAKAWNDELETARRVLRENQERGAKGDR